MRITTLWGNSCLRRLNSPTLTSTNSSTYSNSTAYKCIVYLCMSSRDSLWRRYLEISTFNYWWTSDSLGAYISWASMWRQTQCGINLAQQNSDSTIKRRSTTSRRLSPPSFRIRPNLILTSRSTTSNNPMWSQRSTSTRYGPNWVRKCFYRESHTKPRSCSLRPSPMPRWSKT